MISGDVSVVGNGLKLIVVRFLWIGGCGGVGDLKVRRRMRFVIVCE